MLLPITNYEKEIISSVKSHYVTIISAQTGSGKSTQVPQYLAKCYSQVIVTEPRIMSAKTLAMRVSEEMGVTLGEEVGYNTAFDKCFSPGSNILYCTDGIQLIRTIFNENTEDERILVIDEVHEWNLNIEVLVAWCKYMQKRWNTKVVIMSATMNTDGLANFFDDVTVLNIPERLYHVTIEERPEHALIDTIKEKIKCRKNILVFVAGKNEIQHVMKELENENATVLPLHGEMNWDEQKKCFEDYNTSKVIVSTNIAQTGLTIPGINVVVDTGEAKMSVARNGIQGIELVNVSLSDILQRLGRACRTEDGEYILCSNTPINSRAEYTIPEIKRSILDRVVLQLTAIGLNAEDLEFFHQPNIKDIFIAKKELTAIGAISDGKITDIGRKMAKIPVNPQLARMIIEAQKYGVTEQVITISAIIQMDGLFTKDCKYCKFTQESQSDLLASLDVWEQINKLPYIDFQKLGIKKKVYYEIKKYIQKLKESLYGIVEFTHNDNRNAIIKSCLTGLVSHIYINDYNNRYSSVNGTNFLLDNNSCLYIHPEFVIGIPKRINNNLNLITFATNVSETLLLELVPDQITEETSLRYSRNADAVEVTVTKYFEGKLIDKKVYYDHNHPAYNDIKTKFEQEQKSYSNTRQEVVVIDGKQFNVIYSFNSRVIIYIDLETLFSTKEKEVFLDNGNKVYLRSSELLSQETTSIAELRNAIERNRLNKIQKNMKYEYDFIKVNSIYDVITNSRKLGNIELTMNNGGYGDTPIIAYGYLLLNKHTVKFTLGNDEEVANSKTLEALQYLFLKEVQKNYGENKFSHQEGKKKKVLTKTEMESKKEFDSVVKELMLSLTPKNVVENLEFIEEYYQDLMK